ncbi:hypothetical protein OIDMADRAFT_38738 [Oidiodendron maius Zn]|uniref:Thioesterase domain-containing protein n=1 Tax=Oidiodendron maius (strain Zn) TaxID=913774 RepID=A0A0C3HE06_OIDMZ|nr:hypothetical protein OIDMADRAFT_38738 [Oidiodendron maius Zn]
MANRDLRNRRRKDYGYILEYRTRCIYNFLYDSVVNTYLIENCGLQPPTSSQYGLVVHSHSDYFGSIAFPAVAELALRVNKLGKSSVTYEIALFERGVEEVKAVGEFVHVFVNRSTKRPAADGMNTSIRDGLQQILIQQSKL